ncbi:MAG: pyridoxal-phosphate dependent enzyme [Chloroflexi bacterium]|nr:pyridoxal-phosphate dependent enzyme [Chloroflexota bacterium]
MKPLHAVTPLWHSPALSAAAGTTVLLKMEAFQPSGSFKARGMGAACLAAKKAGATRIVCASGGNAGYAVAYAGQQLQLDVSIVVPQTTPLRTKELIHSAGANLIVHAASWDDAYAHAVMLAQQTSAMNIHPFDDPQVWQGHASLVHEIAGAGIKPGAIVLSVGGGGLLCGVAMGLHSVGWSDVPIVAVETEGAASFAQSLQADRLITLDRITSIATTLGARTVAQQALDWTRRHPIVPWVISDRAAVDACLRFADDHRVLVEPACGAALAAGYLRSPALIDRDPMVIIVCGGVGVTRELLQKWNEQVE